MILLINLLLDGGTNGLSPLYMLSEIFGRLQFDLKRDDELVPAQFVDMIIGTGVGGLVAILLGRLLMTPAQAIEAYYKLSPAISTKVAADQSERESNTARFKHAFDQLLKDAGYDPESLFETRCKEPRNCKTVICVMNQDTTQCQLLRSYRIRGAPNPEYTITQVALASIASPEIYGPISLGNGFKKTIFSSALIGYANPTQQLLKEAHAVFGDINVATIVSLGTGKIETSGSFDSDDWMYSMARQVTLDTQRTHEDIYDRLKQTSIYFRLNIDKATHTSHDTAAIVAMTSVYMTETAVSDTIDELVRSFQVETHRVSLRDINSVTKVDISIKPRPALTHNFVGRDDILEELHRTHLSSQGPQRKSPLISVLTGLGGCGKTQIALKFALDYEHRYPEAPVYFLDARSPERLQTELETVIRARGPAHRSQTYQDAIDWIAAQEQWLLIFDSADDPSLNLSTYIPNSSSGHVIITTRNDLVRAQSPENSHKVDSLPVAHACHLLLVASGYDTSHNNVIHSQKIVKELGCLPLAVAHAAGYILIHRCLDTYLHLYRQRRRELLSRSDPNVVQGREGSVATTIHLSFGRLSREAQLLLQFLSLFHAASISHSVIATAALRNFAFTPFAMQASDPLEEEHANALMKLICPSGAWSAFDFNEMIQQCLQYSLIQITMVEGAGKYYSMHVLVQSWLRLDLPQDHLFHRLLVRLLASSITADDNYENLLFHRVVLPHIEGAIVGLDTNVADSFAFGFILEESKHSPQAVRYFRRALVLCMEMFGEAHQDTISAMGRLASSLDSCGRFREGMELKLKVLNGRRSLLGEAHPDTLRVMNNLARSFDWLGMREEAIEMDELVLKLRRRVQGNEHPDVLLTLANLAVSLKK
ncbi:hypothetical protein FRC17_005263, partial [Serendipita sp. 399]